MKGLSIAVAVGALAFVVPPAAAPASNDPCTQTGSNLLGSGSRDVLCGTSGDDLLNGRGGNDELRGSGGNDTLTGSSGDDTLFGGHGNDSIDGGSGGDQFDAGAGNDVVRMRDGEIDSLFSQCGPGTDSLDIDLADATAAQLLNTLNVFAFKSSAIFPDCENLTVGAVNEGANVAISGRGLRVGADGRTSVRLHCPGSLDISCSGSLRLGLLTKSKKKGVPASRYSLRAGETGSVPVRLSRADRGILTPRRHAAGGVLSVERGHFGSKTTFKAVRLTAPR